MIVHHCSKLWKDHLAWRWQKDTRNIRAAFPRGWIVVFSLLKDRALPAIYKLNERHDNNIGALQSHGEDCCLNNHNKWRSTASKSQKSAGLYPRPWTREGVWLTSWPGTRQEIHALEAVTHTMVCDILWPLHQLLHVFWCLKCFESGLPCTGDTGQKNHHQSPGCPRERHSQLVFWGFTLSAAQLRSRISCFDIERMIDVPLVSMQTTFYFAVFGTGHVNWNKARQRLCSNEGLWTLYPASDCQHRHHSVVLLSHIITFNKRDLLFITSSFLTARTHFW